MPTLVCPQCGEEAAFHPDEVKDVKNGKAVCASCGLEHEYHVFLGEVLNGEHPELIAQLKAQLEEEA